MTTETVDAVRTDRPGAASLATADPDAVALARVMVVDDVRTNIDLLERLLTRAGVGSVVGFTDPYLALEECRRVHPDLVLLDLHMPQLDGVQFLEQLQAALGPHDFLPVLVLTADITERARRAVLTAGAKDFLTKPFDTVEVVLRVRNLLETGALYNQLRDHSASLQAELDAQLERDRIEADLQRARLARIEEALHADGMTIVFQPFVTLEDFRIVGAEALARFAGPPSRPPNEWFDEAAQVGCLTQLEHSAVSLAVNRLSDFPQDAFLSVNVSPATLMGPHLMPMLDSLPADRIVLEVTEHARVDDYDGLSRRLAPFVARGGRVAIDDAGAGYAGLQHILRLRPAIIKLDIALTKGIDLDPARRSLATALVRFAAEIGATIIAEGIETETELDILRDLGVPWGQGFHLAKPAALPLALDPAIEPAPPR